MEAAVAFIDDDMAGVVSQDQPVAGEKQGRNLFDPMLVIEIQRPHPPMRRLEKRQTCLLGGKLELSVPDIGPAVGMADNVQIPDPDLTEGAGPYVRNRHGRASPAGAEPVAVPTQHGRIPKIQQAGDGMLHDGNPGHRLRHEGRYVARSPRAPRRNSRRVMPGFIVTLVLPCNGAPNRGEIGSRPLVQGFPATKISRRAGQAQNRYPKQVDLGALISPIEGPLTPRLRKYG